MARNRRRTPTPARSHVALPCAYEKRRCAPAPAPVLLRKRRRIPAPAPSLKTKAGRGLCPVPPFCVPISQQAAFVGAPAVGWFSDAARAFWLRPASDCRPLCQLCGPLVTGHRAGRHPPCRLLAACALLAGADLQLVGLRLVARPGAAQPTVSNLLANDLLAALKLLACPVAPVVQRVGFGHGAVAEHQAMRAAVGLENARAQEDVCQAEHGD